MSLIQSNIWITPNHYGNRSGYQCCYTNFQYPGIHPCSRCSQCTITRHSTCMDSQHPDCWNSVCHDSILMFKVSTRVVACKHDFFTYHDIASSCCGKATSALHLCTASALSWLLCASLQANKILLIRGLCLALSWSNSRTVPAMLQPQLKTVHHWEPMRGELYLSRVLYFVVHDILARLCLRDTSEFWMTDFTAFQPRPPVRVTLGMSFVCFWFYWQMQGFFFAQESFSGFSMSHRLDLRKSTF